MNARDDVEASTAIGELSPDAAAFVEAVLRYELSRRAGARCIIAGSARAARRAAAARARAVARARALRLVARA